jgi:Flp pilus assembly protein TadB
MNWTLSMSLATALLSTGVGLILYVALEAAGLAIYGGWVRYRGGLTRQVRRLRGMEPSQTLPEPVVTQKGKPRLRPEDAIGLGMAVGVILTRDVLLSILVIIAGVAIWFWVRRMRTQQYDDRLLSDLEVVLLQLRSRLPVTHSIHQSLVAAAQNLSQFSLLRPALAESARRLEMQQAPREACKPLFDIPNDLVQRLAHALSWSADTSESLQVELMGMLGDEIQHQNRIKAEIRRTIGLVRATVRVLQGAAVAGFLVAVTVPMWRDYFFADFSHRMLLATLFVLSGLASAFFEYRLSTALKGDAL